MCLGTHRFTGGHEAEAGMEHTDSYERVFAMYPSLVTQLAKIPAARFPVSVSKCRDVVMDRNIYNDKYLACGI